MRETKLYSALVELDGYELNRLHRFVLSPYFNQNEALIRLFEWIKEDLKTPNGKKINKETLWEICYGLEEPFNDGRFRKLQSDLLKLIEEYYSQEAFESNQMQKAKFLLDSIYLNNLKELQASSLRSAKKIIEEQILKPASFYYYKYEIEQSTFKLTTLDEERSSKVNIEAIAENLDRFYLAEKLRYYCTILNHQYVTVLNYKMLFIDEIIDHIKTHDYSDTPPITIYYQILLSYQEPDETKHFENLKSLIEQHIHLFTEIEVSEILESALNYCLKKGNAGNQDFVLEFFNLYQSWLEKGLLFVRNTLDPFHFKNAVTAGLRLGRFDWVENYISKYASSLEEQYRENAVTFNLAQLYFYKKEYSKVISLLSKVEYEDITYNLNSKTLLMASYYELDELEALNSLLDTFRVYLNRNKNIPEVRRKHYINTINIVRKLAKIRSGDKVGIEKLEKEIEATQGIVSKNWILEKLASLRN